MKHMLLKLNSPHVDTEEFTEAYWNFGTRRRPPDSLLTKNSSVIICNQGCLSIIHRSRRNSKPRRWSRHRPRTPAKETGRLLQPIIGGPSPVQNRRSRSHSGPPNKVVDQNWNNLQHRRTDILCKITAAPGMYVLEEPRFLRHDYHSTDDNDDDAEKVLTEDEREKIVKDNLDVPTCRRQKGDGRRPSDSQLITNILWISKHFSI